MQKLFFFTTENSDGRVEEVFKSLLYSGHIMFVQWITSSFNTIITLSAEQSYYDQSWKRINVKQLDTVKIIENMSKITDRQTYWL